MTYLMEAAGEGQRLLAQEAANPSADRLRLTGLRAGMRAVDVGCGAGAVTSSMLALVGSAGHVTALEPSPERLEEARAHVGNSPTVEFLRAGLPATGLADGSFDYAWCQYVLEYFKDPAPAVAELIRIVRPGGRIVAAEIDGFGLSYWPAPDGVERGKETFLSALAATGFDLFIGRKLYGLFRSAGLVDVRVHLSPFHVTAGAADDRLLADWQQRFEVLTPAMVPAFGGAEAYRRFADAYLALLRDEDAFKYSVTLTVVGTRP